MRSSSTVNPFLVDGNWYSGSVHNHTTASDGKNTVAELAEWYQGHGMDFIVITDHNVIADVSEASDLDITVIPGAEIAVCWVAVFGAEILGLGIETVKRQGLHPQDVIHDVLDQGGLPFLSHPHLSGVYSGLIMDLEGLMGIEIYNLFGVNAGNRGKATIHMDDLMAVGKIVWGLATDDRHAIDDTGPQAWIEVKAESNDRDTILKAMKKGLYYSTTGGKIHDISITDTHVRVKCSEAQCITFSTLPWLSAKVDAGDQGFMAEAEVELDAIGSSQTIEWFNRQLIEKGMQSAPKEIRPHVRIEVDDGQGGFAWSNPLPLP
jgi:predicted metal-dependent phosphoesterase TrpH